MITVKEAAQRMNVKPCTLHNKDGKYYKYYKSPSPGEKNAKFDYEKYKNDEDIKFSLIAQVQLLVEYLVHMENIKYSEIARAAKVTPQSISSLTYGVNAATRIAKWCRDNKIDEFIRYHIYYGYSTNKILKEKNE